MSIRVASIQERYCTGFVNSANVTGTKPGFERVPTSLVFAQ